MNVIPILVYPCEALHVDGKKSGNNIANINMCVCVSWILFDSLWTPNMT